MTQIYIIKMIKYPEQKSICLNQAQYEDFIEVTEQYSTDSYPEECFSLVTVETLNNNYYYKNTTLTCEEATKKTSLAMHLHLTILKETIKINLLK